MILAVECDVENEVICAPQNVNSLFEFPTPIFHLGSYPVTRTVFLIVLAALFVIGLLYFGLRRQRMVPTKFEVMVESVVEFVRDGVGRDVIGPEGVKYVPYLLSLFLFILIGNLFEITPLINFPITSRMALPLMLALITYVIFVLVGFKKNGFRYLLDAAWPKAVPVAMRPLVGLIEMVSAFILRPFTLAVRLFANMVAGHLMLVLLLGSSFIFLTSWGEIGLKSLVGVPWLALGLFILVFELVVAVLQAYIFTLLSAVYIESSINFEH